MTAARRIAARAVAAAALALAAAGCNSFTVNQTNAFVDEDGLVLTVRYGQMEKEKTTTFRSPVNGKDVELRSRLAVSLTLPEPNGSTVMAYQCLNMLPSGTMYKSSDGKWLFHANGISCSLYLVNETGDDHYLVFSGIMGGGPKREDAR